MGKLTGLITTAAVFGIVAIFIYYCCRLKKKRERANGGGTSSNRWSDVFFKQSQQDGREDAPPHVSPPTYQPQVPHSSLVNPNATFNANPYAHSYPYPYPGQAPADYPGNAPYPLGPPINMPMPMPMPLGAGVNYNRQEATAPPFAYPTPSGRPDDLPPPYHEAINSPPQRY